MLDTQTKNLINSARDILVGKIPDPKGQIEQITNALIYKFMDDQDRESQKLGGKASFFTERIEKYAWHKLFDSKLQNRDRAMLYTEGIEILKTSKHLPPLFQAIFKDAYLPFRADDTIALFLNEINKFNYDNSETLGNAFEYLLSIMGAQGDAGQFRTPRHIIKFIVDVVQPKKDEIIFDPACGTAGFLIEAYKYIKNNEELSSKDKQILGENIIGIDIDPTMAKLSRVNLYLHGFKTPKITENDTLTNESLWQAKKYNCILANPPFMTPKGGIQPHEKFTVQAKRSEVLFVGFIAEHLRLEGRAGIIVPEGIIFQAANAYKNLRKYLVEDWGLWAVVSLPSGVFQPYSGVKTSILFLDRAKKTADILFLKVENDGFDLGAQRRPIDKNDLPECLEVLRAYNVSRDRSRPVPTKIQETEKTPYEKISHTVPKTQIAQTGEYNLTGDRYRETQDYKNAKWEMVELGEVVELVRGITYLKKDEVENGALVLRANNINLDSSLNLKDIKNISQNLDLKGKCKLKKNDIFICLASGSKSHIGKVAFIENDTDFYFGGFMGAIRITNKNKVISQYVFQQLKNSKFNDYLREQISGVNINNLNSTILKSYKIPLPPLEIQKQIVAEIEAEQKAIEECKNLIEKMEQKIERKIGEVWNG